jgi:hypothetical protein
MRVPACSPSSRRAAPRCGAVSASIRSRHHLPDVVGKRVFPVLARVVRRRVHGDGGLPAVRPGDFTVHGDDLERPRDLLRQWRR